MRRLLCPTLPSRGGEVELEPAEARHATHVLRLRNGDTIEAIDGSGRSAVGKLKVRGERVWLEISAEAPVRTANEFSSAKPEFILEVAVLKGEAMEWVVEKAVELGIHRLVPVLTAHTVVQIKAKGPEAFRERWQRIADQALKQCGRLNRMAVDSPIPLEELLARSPGRAEAPRLWADEKAGGQAPHLMEWALEKRQAPPDAIRLLIGPEGGWSEQERLLLNSSSVQQITLGKLILRAETAALFGTSLLSGAFPALDNKTQKKG